MKVSVNGAASEPYSSTELYSGSWRQRPQRAFIHKTLTLATPPSQPTHTAHTRAGCSTTGSRAWDSMWESSTLHGSSHLQVCATTVAYRVVSWTCLTSLLPPDAHHARPAVCAIRASVAMPLFCITAFHTYRTRVKVAEPAGSQFCLVEG